MRDVKYVTDATDKICSSGDLAQGGVGALSISR
jgi:hypothetical protein